MWRRVITLGKLFESYEVAGLERRCSPVLHDYEYQSLGCIEHGKYFRRVSAYINALRLCFQPVRKSDVVYAFSLDILLWAYLIKTITFSKCKLAYEVADIHPLLTLNGFKGRFVRAIERFLVKRCAVSVFTSTSFYSGYFGEVQRFTDFKAITIENKVSLPASVRNEVVFKKPKQDSVTLGYFGLMKSPDSFRLITRLVDDAKGRIHVMFRGRFVYPLNEDDCLKVIDASPWMEYGGPYRSPSDLKSLYESVDIVWDAYKEGENARWQRTTRFSEACFFKRPLVYNPTTQDGKLAEEHRLGISMSFDGYECLLHDLLTVDEIWLRNCYARFEKLPTSLVVYENEYEALADCLEVTGS